MFVMFLLFDSIKCKKKKNYEYKYLIFKHYINPEYLRFWVCMGLIATPPSTKKSICLVHGVVIINFIYSKKHTRVSLKGDMNNHLLNMFECLSGCPVFVDPTIDFFIFLWKGRALSLQHQKIPPNTCTCRYNCFEWYVTI